MRIARLGDQSTALVILRGENGNVQDVVLPVWENLRAFTQSDSSNASLLSDLLTDEGRGSWVRLIDEWDTAAAAFDAFEAWAARASRSLRVLPLSDVTLDAPLSASDIGVFPVGANFAQHAALASTQGAASASELAHREQTLIDNKLTGAPPWGFTVLPRTIVGPEAKLAVPSRLHHFDYEGEVAIILRSTATLVETWGVTAWHDVSVRGHKFGGFRADEGPLTWSLQKNFDCGNVCGPWVLVEPRLPVDRLSITTRVNGEVRQSGNTKEMVYSFAEVVEHLSQFFILRSGDMITSGTPAGTAVEQGPAGPYLKAGDVVEIEVEGVGVLRNRFEPSERARQNTRIARV
jgi:2-keto-4-pentenoate hydratase/2-oxohepta-3-ene-1,7-dioic acid hydratase in catechol pathway